MSLLLTKYYYSMHKVWAQTSRISFVSVYDVVSAYNPTKSAGKMGTTVLNLGMEIAYWIIFGILLCKQVK